MPDPFLIISSRIKRFIEGVSTETFEELALDLFDLQRRLNPAYARLCDLRKITIVHTWQEIPAIPTVAFKELEMTSLMPLERDRVFYSSGTTQTDRSQHFHSAASLKLYELSLWQHFRNRFDFTTQPLILTPPSQTSSLAHMFEYIAAKCPNSEFFGLDEGNAWTVDLPRLMEALRSATQPLALLGTAFQFVHLLDALPAPVRLPENSWLLETGGYKGRSRDVPKAELHELLSERLGLPRARIFSEYGMSELSSQAYDCADGRFEFPKWARVQIINPATNRPASEGEPGLIRVYDLANVWSVMAIQTEDLGVQVGDKFQLLGRAPSAQARGCSLMNL